MADGTSGITAPNYLSAGRLKGSARGAMIGASFGSVWMYWAVLFSGNPTPLWFAIVTVPTVAVMAWAIIHVRAARRLSYSPEDLRWWKSIRKFFWMDAGIEWGLMAVAATLLARVDRPDLIPQAIGVITGLHFLPLARILRAPIYYGTGIVMTLAALGSLLIPRGDTRNVVACAAEGLALWVTCLINLRRISLASGRTTPQEPRVS